MNFCSIPTTDSSIRVALDSKIKNGIQNNKKIKIIHELGVSHGSRRIDIVTVQEDIMHGYEIKSDADTLDRLPEQARAYNAVFDKITLVVGNKHLLKSLDSIPEWWGVIVAKPNPSGQILFYKVRSAEQNTSQDELAIARLLWKEEALAILSKHGYYISGKQNRESIYAEMSSVLSLSEVKCEVLKILASGRHREKADPR